MMTLHTFGDSHAGRWAGWGSIELDDLKIVMHSYPSKLMYSWSLKEADPDDRFDLIDFKKGDYICFCFGEIDMRAHIHKYKQEWQSNIDTMLDRYLSKISYKVKDKNINIIISNIIPHLYNVPCLTGTPRVGAPADVKKYTLYANGCLKKKALARDFVYLDVYDKCLNEQGYLKVEISDKICHISNPKYIREWLINF